jgi:hypothetical protein
MQDKHASVKVIRSVWRRTTTGYVKVRDLQPERDVKGGGRTPGAMAALPLSSSGLVRDRWLRQLTAARDDIIRKLFQRPTDRERKERIERIARAQRNFLRWIKRG